MHTKQIQTVWNMNCREGVLSCLALRRQNSVKKRLWGIENRKMANMWSNRWRSKMSEEDNRNFYDGQRTSLQTWDLDKQSRHNHTARDDLLQIHFLPSRHASEKMQSLTQPLRRWQRSREQAHFVLCNSRIFVEPQRQETWRSETSVHHSVVSNQTLSTASSNLLR